MTMPQNTVQLVDCPECESTVAAEVLHTLDVEDPPWALRARYCFLACPRCRSALLTTQSDDGPGWDAPVRVFPPRDSGLGWAVPERIRHAFDEARACFGAKAYTAAAIMCRKATEGLCADKRASGRALTERLRALKEDGVVDARLYAWADELRIWGNEAAHDVGVSISEVDAADLLEFTRALMEYVYTFGNRFDEFRARRRGVRTANRDGQPEANALDEP
jgi:hypothetical protein